MKALLAILLILSASAQADDWLCKQESSIELGDDFHACGIGHGKDENDARGEAFNNAKSEFERVCSASYGCNPKTVAAKPGRTDCHASPTGYKCYRLVVFTPVTGTSSEDPNTPPPPPDDLSAELALSLTD
jgi:hypothetical protein